MNLKSLILKLGGKSEKSNVDLCSTESMWNHYFDQHEGYIDDQWDKIIWPIINQFDFSSILELAPGAGRNTQKLLPLSKHMFAIDLNKSALSRLEKRFEQEISNGLLKLIKNDGASLPEVVPESISLIYCWDSAVHFDKKVMEKYIAEFARVLLPGGRGFIHHSNLGKWARYDIKSNPHWRSNVSKNLFKEFCNNNGLSVIDQHLIPWGEGEINDCITVFEKAQ